MFQVSTPSPQRTLDPEDGSSDEEERIAAEVAAELREREQAGSSTSQPAGASGPGQHVEDDSKPKDAPQPIKPISLPEPAYLPPDRHHGGGRGH